MAKYLQQVLNLPEPIFSSGLAKLEKATGDSGIDVRLIADVMAKAHNVMRKLGLDIKNTTAHELYFALNSSAKNGTGDDLLADMDYVLHIIDGKIISFNLIDVIENLHHELPLGKNIISHGQRGLRGELVGRYIEHVRTDEATTRETAIQIGLLQDCDECYNNHKHKHHLAEKILKGKE